jgi:hypothetical protein
MLFDFDILLCFADSISCQSEDRGSRRLDPYVHSNIDYVERLDYVVRDGWGKRYVVDVTALIVCLEPQDGIQGFKVGLTLEDGDEVENIWHAKLSQEDGLLFAVSEEVQPAFNEENECVIHFTLHVVRKSTNVPKLPVSMTINGQVCPVRAYFARELADCSLDPPPPPVVEPEDGESPCSSPLASPRLKPKQSGGPGPQEDSETVGDKASGMVSKKRAFHQTCNSFPFRSFMHCNT